MFEAHTNGQNRWRLIGGISRAGSVTILCERISTAACNWPGEAAQAAQLASVFRVVGECLPRHVTAPNERLARRLFRAVTASRKSPPGPQEAPGA